MLFTLGLMGISILGLALTPNYASIGLAAPILIVVWRLCQGFALGGEVGPTTAFLVEASPVAHRGYYASWQGASQGVATLTAGLVGITIAQVLGADALNSWGWRIAFGLGALTLPFALLIRRGLPETLHHADPHTAAHATGLGGHARIITLGLCLILAGTIPTYVLNYMTTYAVTTLGIPTAVAVAAPLAQGATGLVCTLAAGALSDRFGRKPLMILPRILLIAAVIPVFQWIVHRHDAVGLLGGTAALAMLLNFSSAAALVSITESLRKDIRGTGVATIYAVSVAVFGGTTQPIIALLIHNTGNPLAPGWYMLGACIIGLVAAILMPETAPRFARSAPAEPPVSTPAVAG
jgi:MFS family permease